MACDKYALGCLNGRVVVETRAVYLKVWRFNMRDVIGTLNNLCLLPTITLHLQLTTFIFLQPSIFNNNHRYSLKAWLSPTTQRVDDIETLLAHEPLGSNFRATVIAMALQHANFLKLGMDIPILCSPSIASDSYAKCRGIVMASQA